MRWTNGDIDYSLMMHKHERWMRTRIRKWGNSLGVRIPSSVAADAHLQEGEEVDVIVREGELVIVRVPLLADLVALITKDNLPDPSNDVPRGAEAW